MGERLCDLEYADVVACLLDTAESVQLMLDRLARAVIPFGMCFAPSKCKAMHHDWDSPGPLLTLNSVRLDVVDRSTYLDSCLSKDGSIGLEINALPVKPEWPSQIAAAVRSVLLYGYETWPLRQQDVHRLEVFDHRCLRQLAQGWME